jgi:hypothetical protein
MGHVSTLLTGRGLAGCLVVSCAHDGPGRAVRLSLHCAAWATNQRRAGVEHVRHYAPAPSTLNASINRRSSSAVSRTGSSAGFLREAPERP